MGFVIAIIALAAHDYETNHAPQPYVRHSGACA